jgi:hypothetical protein
VPRNSGAVGTRRVTLRNARIASSLDDGSPDRSGFQPVAHRRALDGADDDTARLVGA